MLRNPHFTYQLYGKGFPVLTFEKALIRSMTRWRFWYRLPSSAKIFSNVGPGRTHASRNFSLVLVGFRNGLPQSQGRNR